MTNGHRSFPAFTHVYLILSYFLILTSPLLAALIASKHMNLPIGTWTNAEIVSGLLVVALLISNRYASTEALSYHDGLLFITTYCRTGWTYNTLIVVLPVLVFTFACVFVFSTFEALCRQRGITAKCFHRLIEVAFNHRAIQ